MPLQEKGKCPNHLVYDGVWVLQTDAEVTAVEGALKYKELWMVEAVFRSFKSVLETRPERS